MNCGGPANPDAGYPYPPTSVGVYGYDPGYAILRAPGSFSDFMSYCQPLWISDYTYKAVMNYRANNPAPPAAAPQRSMLVWGRIGPTGVVLEPSFEIDAIPSLPERAGPYRVQATDDAGREVFNLSFEADALDHAPNERQFAFVVPLQRFAAGPSSALGS